MTTAAILATGESMSPAVADSVVNCDVVIAVNDSYRLAPWADALAANDAAWWLAHPEAYRFAGRKFSANEILGVERVVSPGQLSSSSSSGVLAMEVALIFGANRILLLGFDMRGSHWFGSHPAPLKNTDPARFEIFKARMRDWGRAHGGVEVVNCTPGSALECFERKTLGEALA